MRLTHLASRRLWIFLSFTFLAYLRSTDSRSFSGSRKLVGLKDGTKFFDTVLALHNRHTLSNHTLERGRFLSQSFIPASIIPSIPNTGDGENFFKVIFFVPGRGFLLGQTTTDDITNNLFFLPREGYYNANKDITFKVMPAGVGVAVGVGVGVGAKYNLFQSYEKL